MRELWKRFKFLFFNTLYLWTTALVSPLAISYRDFSFLLYLFSFFAPTSLVGFSCTLHVYLEAPYAPISLKKRKAPFSTLRVYKGNT
jgi:hypothetical protein